MPATEFGDEIVTATNTGDLNLTNLEIEDDLRDLTEDWGDLAPESNCVLTGTYEVTQPDLDAGEVTNTASADADEIEVVSYSLTTALALVIFDDRFEDNGS